MKKQLVRDKVPVIAQGITRQVRWSIATREELKQLLRDQLLDEVAEYHETGELIELADLLEAVYTLAALEHNTKRNELELIRIRRLQTLGGFLPGVVILPESAAPSEDIDIEITEAEETP